MVVGHETDRDLYDGILLWAIRGHSGCTVDFAARPSGII
jgi:hypothetical protein